MMKFHIVFIIFPMQETWDEQWQAMYKKPWAHELQNTTYGYEVTDLNHLREKRENKLAKIY